MARELSVDELVEHLTLFHDELELLRNKARATRLGFSLLLKHLLWRGPFLRGRSHLVDNAVEFVAGHVGGSAGVIDHIHFGRSGDLAANRRDEQRLSMLCLHILQSSLGFVNTILIQDIVAELEGSTRSATPTGAVWPPCSPQT